MDLNQTITIDGDTYAYTVDLGDGTYRFAVDGRHYRFRQWRWGEKNRVTDAALVADAATGALRIDLARFNALMLAACLVEAADLSTITPATLQDLHPVLGDRLLAIAYWVCELPEGQKKSLINALRERRDHPDLTTFRLCQEFGWTPQAVREQPARDVATVVTILNELDQQATLVPAAPDATTILITET